MGVDQERNSINNKGISPDFLFLNYYFSKSTKFTIKTIVDLSTSSETLLLVFFELVQTLKTVL